MYARRELVKNEYCHFVFNKWVPRSLCGAIDFHLAVLARWRVKLVIENCERFRPTVVVSRCWFVEMRGGIGVRAYSTFVSELVMGQAFA
jgi:hypothetical protein